MNEELKETLKSLKEKMAKFNEACDKEPPDCEAIVDTYEEVWKALNTHLALAYQKRGWSPEKIEKELKKRRW